MIARKLLTGAVLMGAIACAPATQEIDDPAMEADAAQAGAQTADLGENDAEADDATMVAGVQTVGTSLQSLVGRHQSYAATNGLTSVPGVDDAFLAQDGGDDSVSWDGTSLVLNWSIDESGLSYSYGVNLTFGATADGGTSIDGSYALDYYVGVLGAGTSYNVDATYDALTTNSDGCVVSGSLTINYAYELDVAGGLLGGLGGLAGGATSNSGTIIATFAGCDVVTVSGT